MTVCSVVVWGPWAALVLVVRADLDMGAGKAAAQCCHATLGVYQSLEAGPPLTVCSYCPSVPTPRSASGGTRGWRRGRGAPSPRLTL